MKQMKNIKTPAYELKLGKGFFAGTNWMCIKCGLRTSQDSMPHPQYSGKCPDTSSGNHIWQQC